MSGWPVFLRGFWNTLFCRDRNRNGGGIVLFIRNNIPALFKVISTDERLIKSFYVELNLRKKKWLLNYFY